MMRDAEVGMVVWRLMTGLLGKECQHSLKAGKGKEIYPPLESLNNSALKITLILTKSRPLQTSQF